ncbi:DUF485 domain-containing protein [Sphingomonas corticis]|jgi:uncharacterized membrane protein (DUF485 family)|uniref:DUF485 domain-containing protein n=1 Tax=Sphingomonas corticis TaxID=2722791 RepID=A0ABX1CPK1_9SPHN|nr:DUF485 domain-containing protein [Sphingomonas corticis]NJR79819.1 DUF485 domain-containing protein [Sphingomonas corticis]
MTDADVARMMADPRYRALLRQRGRLGWMLSAIVTAAYAAFILTIAFDKPALARPLGAGVNSVGIVVGLGLILLSVASTAVYVHRANGAFDRALADLLRDHAA